MEYGLVARWLATYVLLGSAALPISSWLFPRFADRGASLAVPIALAIIGLVGFLVGQLTFAWPALVTGTLVLLTGSYLARGVEINGRAFVEAMVVFSGAFLFLVAVRAVDPSVHPIGGEKFLDFGLLKSLVRTDALPPEDMWFAGEPVQYYYGGHVIAVLLSRLTFTAPRFAYNLALPGFYAAMVTSAYGLAGNMAAAMGARRRLAAGLGAFLVGLAANLHTAWQVFLWALPPVAARPLASAFGIPTEVSTWVPADFFYWDASRIVRTGQVYLPTEFPLFAWLNGDLHAHMMSTPFLLLIVALAFAYWQTPPAAVARRRMLVFGAIPPIAGLIGVVNTWSLPTAGGIVWLTLTFADADPGSLFPKPVREAVPDPPRLSLADEVSRALVALILAMGALAIALVWSAPFWLGLERGRSVAFFPERTRLGALLLIHGGFLSAFVPYLARRVDASLGASYRRVVLILVLFTTVVLSMAVDAAAIGLFGPLLVIAGALLYARRWGVDRVGDVGFETVIMLGGFGLILLVEFVYVVEQAAPERFNTVFKSYAQVWQLFSVAGGVVLARIFDAGRVTFESPGAVQWRRTARGITTMLIILTALYAGFALPNHFADDSPVADVPQPTLNATKFVEVNHPGEAPAIRWLDNRQGQPVIVTAAPASYFWSPAEGAGAAAPSSLTGLPTVAGWVHERGYRNPDVYSRRVNDVLTIYTGSPTEQAKLLREYEVDYIYVGPAERVRYGTITVGDVPGVKRHREFGDVVIYRVELSELPNQLDTDNQSTR